jgi:protease I
MAKVAILATHGFEESELLKPKQALESAGHTITVISPESGSIRAWRHGDWGDEVAVDEGVDEAQVEEYAALVLPGGVINPDSLRLSDAAISFIAAFATTGRPIAAICHGPWTLIDADLTQGRRVTSWPSLRRDLENAGAQWVDEPVVRDGNLITSRKPDDIPDFTQAIVDALEGEFT